MATNTRRVRVNHVSAVPFDVVEVPRAMFTEGLWSLPFAELHGLALKDWRGLKATTTNASVGPAAPPETAWLRCGPQGQAMVYHQNWGGWKAGEGVAAFARAQ